MILFFYNLALLTILLVGSPWWIFRLCTTAKYRDGLLERLGFIRSLKSQSNRPLIWIHAVSVGEVLAVSRLTKILDGALPGHFIAISTTTRTGQQLARERFGKDRVFYCPLDLPWAVAACLRARKPVMLILAETEFWPNLLHQCFRRNVPIVVVNARISDRSWPRYQRLRSLWKPFLSQLTAVLAQSQLDADRLAALGIPQERVTVAGNLKFDVEANADSEATKLIAELKGGLRLVVAGSTLDGEESLLLAAWPAVLRTDPELALVLAPRHPERFTAVADLLTKSGFPWRKRSAIGIKALQPGEIVLLDSIGELASAYSLAAVAFVGGSLVAAGGHNPLEPAQFAVPIAMGPYYANFRAIVDQFRSANAIQIVGPEVLAPAISALLANPRLAAETGSRAQRVFVQQAGATQRTVAQIEAMLADRGEQ